MRHYFFCEGTAAIAEVPGDFSSTSWGRVQNAFAIQASSKPHVAYVRNYALYEDQQYAGVYWDEQLASISGMSFVLLPTGLSIPEAIQVCENHLRKDRDVVSLRVLKPARFISDALQALVDAEARRVAAVKNES